MISVVIPLYNKEKQIANTLHSVLPQTFQNFEIVVVDDGSTDNSVQEVEKVNDIRIRIVHQKNAGVSAARNKGIEEAKYDLIAFLDADDKWKAEYLETQYYLFQKYSQCSVYACGYEFSDSNGNVSGTIIRKLPFQEEDGVLTNYFEVASCSHPPIWTSAVMVKKDAIQAVGGFPVGIKSGEDLLTWARLAVLYKIAYSKHSLAVFIFDPLIFTQDQKERRPEQKDKVAIELKKIYLCHKNIKGLKSYISLWHKMRTHIFIDKHCRIKALKECLKSISWSINKKNIAFLLLLLLPFSFFKYIMNKFS